ncbi:MAG: hypothetical protein FIB00_02915 [Chloroflexi bacterium]|nr:hypothetical protein [Chloroflexota bacterium]PWB41398.1 MAG: hypothetical protein C3F10_15830 [Dehalococcoidia bacterium]
MLQNEFYAGYIHRRGERRRGAHEPIVSEELWLRVQERIGRGYAAPRSRSPRALSGIAVCAECQGPLWLTTSGNPRYPHLRRAYYRETSKIRQRPCSKRRTSWRAEAAEEEVASVIRAMAFDREWCARIDREARRLPQGDAYAAERTELVGSRRRATRAYVAGDLEEAEWNRIKTAIDARLAAIPAPLPGGVLFGLERLIEVGRVWDGMAQEEQREGVRLVFERVELDTANKLIWLKPWPEFDSLFRHRREFVSLVPSERLELPTF